MRLALALLSTGFALVLQAAPIQASALSVTVDTGHTPQHPGARTPGGRVEYRFNLELSNEVSDALNKAGVQVSRVAADGQEVELFKRATMHADADLFVSIHHDSIQQAWIDAGRRGEFSGYSVFVSERNPDYEKSLQCATAIAEKLQAAGESPSLYHATPIPGENRPLIDARLGIHRFDDLVVLRTAAMPAVLVEAGVIANPAEEIRLAKEDTRARLAQAIADGILACMKP